MNQLNHYVTTYQKDYTWPYISSACRTPPLTKPIIKACICTDLQPARKELEPDGTLDWSQMGPTGRLVEPKIYPKIKQAPVADVPPFDQPSSICLKEGDPDLIEMLEKSLPRETTARVDGDRMKTTYQMDYSDPAISRMTQRDLAVAVVDANGRRVQCDIPIQITVETECPLCCCLPVSTRNGDTNAWERDRKRRGPSKRSEIKCKSIGRPQMTPIRPWKSEYQDSISKIGHVIVKAKLHHARKKAIPFQYQYSITAN